MIHQIDHEAWIRQQIDAQLEVIRSISFVHRCASQPLLSTSIALPPLICPHQDTLISLVVAILGIKDVMKRNGTIVEQTF